MRVGALYDVHGNLPALEAVLAELERERVELVVVGGDVASGPFPIQTLALLRALGERALFGRGNADRAVAEIAAGAAGGLPDDEWAARRLDPDAVAFLRALPLTVELDIRGIGRVLFCHATPTSDEAI